MAPHGSLKAAHEALSSRRDHSSSQDLSGRATLMITVATCLIGASLVCLSLESLGIATAFFGIAVVLIPRSTVLPTASRPGAVILVSAIAIATLSRIVRVSR